MKVGELYALLTIKGDKGSFRSAEKGINKLDAKLGEMKSKTVDWIKSFGQLAVLGAGAAAITVAKDTLEFEDSLVRLDIASQGAMGSIEEMRTKMLEVSDSTGLAKEEISRGAAAFIALTGDGEAANRTLGVMAKVAKATNTPFEDISKTAGALYNNLNLDPKDFEKAFSTIVASGKAGAVELNDMARTLNNLTPAMAGFANSDGIIGVQTMSTAFQLAQKGFGSAEQTVTGLAALSSEFASKAEQIKKATGFDVFTVNAKGERVLRDFPTIMAELSKSAIATDAAVRSAVFGDTARKAFKMLSAEGGKAFSDLSDKIKGANDVTEDFAKYQASTAGRLTNSWVKFNNVLTKFAIFAGENLKLVTIAVAALATTWIGMSIASTVAATAGVAGFFALSLAAALVLIKFLLIAAVIGLLIYVLYDLYQWLTGGESVLRDLFYAAKDWIFDKLSQGWEATVFALKSLWVDFKDFIIDSIKDLGRKIMDLVEILTPSIGGMQAYLGLNEDEQTIKKTIPDGVSSIDSTLDLFSANPKLSASQELELQANASRRSNSVVNNSPVINVDGAREPLIVAQEVKDILSYEIRNAAEVTQ